MKAFENAAQTKGLQTIDPNDELNLITPQSSTNITPTKHDVNDFFIVFSKIVS